MKIFEKYRRKQLAILSVVFIFCSSVLFLAEYKKEKNLLVNNLNRDLNTYSELLNNYLEEFGIDKNTPKSTIDSFVQIIPDKKIRITIIDFKGKVLYDSRVNNAEGMENHLNRPEIELASRNISGSDIRVSATTQVKYYYFAKKFNNTFIRISIEYNIGAAQLIEPQKLSIFFIVLIFFISAIILVIVTDKFGKSLTLLKKFTNQASQNLSIEDIVDFPKNELGNIGQNIVDIYDKLNKAKTDLLSEKEKLIRHLNLLDEGIAIYTREKKIIANNSYFIQFISLISDNNVSSCENFFEIDAFAPLLEFIDRQIKITSNISAKKSFYEINLTRESRIFSAKGIVFQDKSIEIIIRDITKPEKRKIIKQQLTDNIAHELKTPVSSIKGFLETIIDVQPEKEKLFYFIKKAYSQTCRLANLINNISMLTKIEEAGNLYQIEKIDLFHIVNNVIDDVDIQLRENNIDLKVNIPENLIFDGNPILMYSIFRNLFDNMLSYAGKDLTVILEKYMEDEDFYYFSFSDSGIGVPEEDLSRLFERFYRVDKGREHKKGGTGLGLAIVKNAVLFHRGKISAKNRKEGGLEFLFSLKKVLDAD